jgi:glucosamine--fructose-6-phosphate aminotransferase (isomerizing)
MIAEAEARLARLAPDGPDEMGRELADGPRAVAETLTEAGRLAAELDRLRSRAERVVLIGTGASLAMVLTAEPWFRPAAGRSAGHRPPVLVREASTAVLGAPDGEAFHPGDLAVVVSASGTSPETLAAARLARASGARVLAVTAEAASPLAGTADLVLHTPSGTEGGAATKSELAALAALAVLAGAIPASAHDSAELRRALERVVADAAPAVAIGRALAGARTVWTVGFGSSAGIARAGALLLHEKALIPAVAATPGEFRHGPIEAVTRGDAVVAVDVDAPNGPRSAYLGRLASELAELGVPFAVVGGPGVPLVLGPGGSISLTLPPGPPAALEATLRLQQIVRATAHARGTYRDGFRILRSVVVAADDIVGTG